VVLAYPHCILPFVGGGPPQHPLVKTLFHGKPFHGTCCDVRVLHLFRKGATPVQHTVGINQLCFLVSENIQGSAEAFRFLASHLMQALTLLSGYFNLPESLHWLKDEASKCVL
jgi:hypothetical protein